MSVVRKLLLPAEKGKANLSVGSLPHCLSKQWWALLCHHKALSRDNVLLQDWGPWRGCLSWPGPFTVPWPRHFQEDGVLHAQLCGLSLRAAADFPLKWEIFLLTSLTAAGVVAPPHGHCFLPRQPAWEGLEGTWEPQGAPQHSAQNILQASSEGPETPKPSSAFSPQKVPFLNPGETKDRAVFSTSYLFTQVISYLNSISALLIPAFHYICPEAKGT